MKNNINLSEFGIRTIINLQHRNGTYRYYASALTRLINVVLHQNDELGMSDSEAMATLRALHCIREDLGYIAGAVAETGTIGMQDDENPAEVAARVEATFSVAGDLDDIHDSTYPRIDTMDARDFTVKAGDTPND